MAPTPDLVLRGDKTEDAAYVPSYELEGDDLGPAQREAVASVGALPGWLLEADAMKLYELAYFTPGAILEIGTYRGKSTVVMASALRDAGREGPLVSLDVDRAGLDAALDEARSRGLDGFLALGRGTAEALFRADPGFAPALVFLDGDHSRRGVARDLKTLEPHVPAGAVLLLHDYHDERNADPAEPDYGVTEAVAESWVADQCEFGGVFGCCALFRRAPGAGRVAGPSRLATAEVTELGREPLASWFERRVVGAFARRASAMRS